MLKLHEGVLRLCDGMLRLPPARHVRRNFFAQVDGGQSEGLACADPGARKFVLVQEQTLYSILLFFIPELLPELINITNYKYELIDITIDKP